MQKIYKIFAVNPGSTSTKFALFENETVLYKETIPHDLKELESCDSISAQKSLRTKIMNQHLRKEKIKLQCIDAVVGRGGIIEPLVSGTYEINQKMLSDLNRPKATIHASCLGGMMAYDIGQQYGVPSYIVDPIVVDEREPLAKFSGLQGIQRNSVFHALNAKAVARKCCKELGKSYDKVNLIVTHMGGGITISAHKKGKVVDVSNAIEGEGPFTPERTGSLPLLPIIRMCYSGKYTAAQMEDIITNKGGAYSYLGVKDYKSIEQAANEGHERSQVIIQAMAYQVAKEIGAMAAVLSGNVDRIILTGGIAYGKLLTSYITKYVDFIAPVYISPGEDEMLALCQGVLRVLRGENKALTYIGKDEKSVEYV